MEPTNRRDFLKHASATVAVVGVAAAAPLSIVEKAAADDTKTPKVPAGARVDRHVVAHLRNVQTGEVAIYSGDREITVKDKRLAALLYKASR
jgi:Ubiquitinol-cytochrome C reductase Fe-S subunit TAT signal